MKKFLSRGVDYIFFMNDGKPEDGKPSWKFRRKLIFGAYRLAFAMIIFGAITFLWDTSVSNNLITGGVALMSIIIGAYVAGSSYEDGKVKPEKDLEP